MGDSYEKVTVYLADGQMIDVQLSKPFRSKDNQVCIHDQDKQDHSYPLTEVSRILFLGAPLAHAELMPGEAMESVECHDGMCYQVKALQTQLLDNGFFGIPLDMENGIQRIFFCKGGVKRRVLLNKPLGEILTDDGTLSETAVQDALEAQAALQKKKIGQVISEEHDISMDTMDGVDSIVQLSEKVLGKGKLHLGDILKSAGMITENQLDDALELQKNNKSKHLGQVLIEKAYITEEQMLKTLASQFRMRFVSLTDITPDTAAIDLISGEIARRLHIFPIELHEQQLIVATSNPTNPDIMDTLRFHTNLWIEMVVALDDEIKDKITEHYSNELFIEMDDLGLNDFNVEDEDEDRNLEVEATQGPIVKLANKILMDAIYARASDIHIHPEARALEILFRVDGLMTDYLSISKNTHRNLVARFKIISGMDITEHRMPQDGRIHLKFEGNQLEMRVSCMPGLCGETLVFRILGQGGTKALDEIGLSDTDMQQIRRISHAHHGMLLVTGPTGSGKSTTLASVLQDLVHTRKHLISLEDPVETQMPGVDQIPINDKVGFTFFEALRNVLRHDPNVVMVGEIRDGDTARIAIQAALTGHVLLSTLHANSAASAFVRLADMGVASYLVADTVKGIISQQLLPKLCPHCRVSCAPDEAVMRWIDEYRIALPEAKNFAAPGCEKCNHTGVLGRVLVYEFLPVTREVHQLIVSGASCRDITESARQTGGMRTMVEMGVEVSQQGLTSMEHISVLFMD